MLDKGIELLSRPESLAVGIGLVLFLGLFWALRGAPIGQASAREPDLAPSPASRDRLVAAAILGFLAILAGGPVAIRWGILASLPVFAVGVGTVLRVASLARPHRHASPTLRRLGLFAEAALAAAMLAGILLVGNVVAFRYGGRPIDFTRDEVFGLSSLSKRGVESLDRPLRFTLVLGRSDRSAAWRDRIRRLVDLYRSANPARVSVEELNAFAPAGASAYEAVLKRSPDLGVLQGDAVLLEYGDEGSVSRAAITVADLFREARPSTADPRDPASISFAGEDAITSAIARLREGRRSTIGFTASHGEPPLNELDPRRPGLGTWRSRLASLGNDAVELDLRRDPVPEGVSLVVIVGPRGKFAEEELERLKAYLVRGGPMLVAMNGEVETGLEPLLAMHNVGFEPGMIFDERQDLDGRLDLVLTDPARRGEHPIVDPMAGLSVLVPGASPIRIAGSKAAKPGEVRPTPNPGIMVAPILKTGATSWADTQFADRRPAFDAGAEQAGPMIVGVAASERAEVAGSDGPKPRMVVISTGLVARNETLALPAYNADLLMNAVGWLRGKPDTIGVAPKVHRALVFAAAPKLRASLLFVPTALAFVLILGLGVTTYLARRD